MSLTFFRCDIGFLFIRHPHGTSVWCKIKRWLWHRCSVSTSKRKTLQYVRKLTHPRFPLTFSSDPTAAWCRSASGRWPCPRASRWTRPPPQPLTPSWCGGGTVSRHQTETPTAWRPASSGDATTSFGNYSSVFNAEIIPSLTNICHSKCFIVFVSKWGRIISKHQ